MKRIKPMKTATTEEQATEWLEEQWAILNAERGIEAIRVDLPYSIARELIEMVRERRRDTLEAA